MLDVSLLKKLGFSDKEALVYLALIALGPSSVRNIAKKAELNRGTVYEALKQLQEKEVVNYYDTETRQYFVAEDPTVLFAVTERRERELQEVTKKVKGFVAELKSVYDRGGARPVARYYAQSEISAILKDVLDKCEQSGELMYRAYSDPNIREYLYEGFESFSDARVAKGISVRVVSFGGGGELRGLDERRVLKIKNATPTYTIVYPGNTAFISLNAQAEMVGVVIENGGVHETQKQIFDALWVTLPE